ncbi:ABC-2 type transport system permease protein [Paenibacillus castaneae]|uniref:ABC transporter permease n=1 Tax=Paenibacillus castaneae TaxID=474957 RepID=UPI000C99A580|nr:ABC transporter permease [Paenibacillus castaneae]NIK76731.1 ABC-2 type transport system permease protein [Paenibacillus castaneae]
MNAYLKLAAFDSRLYFRDFLTIFWVLVYPVIMLLLFGFIFGDTTTTEVGPRYIESYVPALCAMNVMSVAVFTLNINMVTARENGILRRFRVTPVRKSTVLASQATQGLFLVLAGAVEIIVIAKLVWDIPMSFMGIVSLFVCLLIGAVGFFSLGLALSGLAKTPGAASGFAMIIFFPSLFLSGISMPVEMFPSFIQNISAWIPMTHFVTMVQGVWQGHAITTYGFELAVMAGFAVIGVVLALLLFRWENK